MTAFSYTADTPPAGEAQMGLIVLKADETIEAEFRRIFRGRPARLFVTRIPSAPEVTPETLAEMTASLPAAASLLPDPVDFDVVGYACTSASSVIGADRVGELVQSGCRTRAVTNPLSAVIAQCKSRGISRLALLSPYVESVSDTLRTALAAAGIETPVFGSFNEAEEARVARISAASVAEAATQLGRDSAAQAVFLSCTNLRTLAPAPLIEAALGKPVLSSNLALAWHMAALSGMADRTAPAASR
ncbi:MAG: aspartate/glutamate racemase family protein [Alphaproteobacteria bacterium]|nr:aspartate/glutamate racemase family protein [Alphaproteobacteria bacterium]NNF23306.1 Asp/Glu racemase [Paracoccaceae bacterium]